MELPQLVPPMPACRKCELGGGPISHPGIPTRLVSRDPTRVGAAAILFVGEAPGANEDAEGQCFTGRSGQIITKLYVQDVFKFHEKADIYYGNAVRCRPTGNATPSDKCVKACREFLLADIAAISRAYARIYVVAAGATAAKSVGEHGSLKAALSHQGHTLDAESKLESLRTPPPKPRKSGGKSARKKKEKSNGRDG